MFTGIIEATAPILSKSASKLAIERPRSFDDTKIGSSIAISGVCLTIINLDATSMSFDVVPTTFAKSKLGRMKVGESVNLERALSASGRFDGHVVQGHCEGAGSVREVKKNEDDVLMTIAFPSGLEPFIVRHGSITIDGVALTIADVSGENLTIALTPFTLEHTTLGRLKSGDAVNLETDIIGRYALKRNVQ